MSQLGSSLERVRCGTDIFRNLTFPCLLLKIQGETGGDVLKVERDNPVVILMIYRTRFYTLSLDSGAQHDDAFV